MMHNVQEKEGYDVLKDKDDWWKVRGFVNGFERNHKQILHSSLIMVLDESMSPYRPRYVCAYEIFQLDIYMYNDFSHYNLNQSYHRTTKTDSLPGLSFVERKPKPLGTEIKYL